MTKQLDRIGLQYEFFDAVDGKRLSREEMLQVCNQKWAKRHIGRQLLPGEIGCALSHLGVYRKIVDEELPYALILEDDVQIDSSVAMRLSKLEQVLNSEEGVVCLLSGSVSLGEELGALGEGCQLMRIASATYLSHAYVVTLEGAKRMLAALYPVVQVADDWGWIGGHTSIELCACHPPMATQLSQDQSESTISGNGEMRNEDLSARWKLWGWWKHKLYCKWWRTVDRVGLGYYFWRKT